MIGNAGTIVEFLGLTMDEYAAQLDNALNPVEAYVTKEFTGKTVFVQLDLEERPEIWGAVQAISMDGNGLGTRIYAWSMYHLTESEKCEHCGEYHIYTFLAFMLKITSPIDLIFTVRFCLEDANMMETLEEISTSGELAFIDRPFEDAVVRLEDGTQVIPALNITIEPEGLAELLQLYNNSPQLLPFFNHPDTM